MKQGLKTNMKEVKLLSTRGEIGEKSILSVSDERNIAVVQLSKYKAR